MGGSGCGLQGDLVAEGFEFADVVALLMFWVDAGVVVAGAPAAASTVAKRRPRPEVAPVTIATSPVRSVDALGSGNVSAIKKSFTE